MRSTRVVRASNSQCRSRNCLGFDPSILRHNGICGAADEGSFEYRTQKEKNKKNIPFVFLGHSVPSVFSFILYSYLISFILILISLISSFSCLTRIPVLWQWLFRCWPCVYHRQSFNRRPPISLFCNFNTHATSVPSQRFWEC
jgi:hypothetical protein